MKLPWPVLLAVLLPVMGVAVSSPATALADTADKADKPVVKVRPATLPPLPDRLWYDGNGRGGLSPTATLRMDSIRRIGQPLRGTVVRLMLKRGGKTGQGSAFFINPQGYAVTNHHVIVKGGKMTVNLLDGSTRTASLVGKDPVSDLALIHVDAREGEVFDYVKLAADFPPQVGDWVMAIGAPFRLDNTLNTGIVSALGRHGSRPKKPNNLRSFIQFDAAVNPGSSGGALFNMRGEVVGVVTATRKDAEGLSFAVPVAGLKRVLKRMADGETIKRSVMGIDLQLLDHDLATAFGVKRRGALIARVSEGSPAEKAGLLTGDIITKWNGLPIDTYADLPWIVATSPADEEVTVTYFRDGEQQAGRVAPVHRLPRPPVRRPKADERSGGAAVTELTAAVAYAMNLSISAGVLVYDIDSKGSSYDAGLRRGDAVLQVGDQPVTTASEYHEAVRTTNVGSMIRLLVVKGRKTTWVAFLREEERAPRKTRHMAAVESL